MSGNSILPLLNQQQRIYLISQFENGSVAYNNFVCYDINGTLHVNVLKEAIHQCICAHPAFLTKFEVSSEGIIQTIDPVDNISINDYFNYYELSIESEIKSTIKSGLKKEFDIHKGPLFNIHLIKTSPSTYSLAISVHHIISDGVSINSFIKELIECYSSMLSEHKSAHGSHAKNYLSDYIRYLNENDHVKYDDEIVNFWKEELKDWSDYSTELLIDYPRKIKKSFNGNRVRLKIDSETTKKIKTFSFRNKSTLFCTLYSIHLVFLHKILNQDRIISGSVFSGRNNSNNDFFGMFVNTLPIKSSITQEDTFKEVLTATTKKIQQIHKYQNYPFDQMLNGLNIKGSLNQNPLFETVFLLQDSPYESISNEFSLNFAPNNKETSIFDILIQAYELNGELHYTWEYDSELIDKINIEYYCEVFQKILYIVIDNPSICIKKISLI